MQIMAFFLLNYVKQLKGTLLRLFWGWWHVSITILLLIFAKIIYNVSHNRLFVSLLCGAIGIDLLTNFLIYTH